MILKKWEDLPDFMRCDAVKPYYDSLVKKKDSLIIKRIFDIGASAVLLVLLSPAMGIIAIWIKADSKGPVFFKQTRITQYGQPFQIYKFRTMINDAEKLGTKVTVKNDSRITKAGKFLRKYRLDELPQLINILKGEMTFVGTRPEVEKYVKAYTDEMKATLLLPAGVTSEASIQYKDEEKILNQSKAEDIDKIYIEKILPKKMKYNQYYLIIFNYTEELKCMLNTVCAVLE